MLIRQKGGWRLHHQAYLWPRRQRSTPPASWSSSVLSPRRRRSSRVNGVAQSESLSSSSAPAPRNNGSRSSGTDNGDISPLLSVSSSSSSDRRDSCGTDDSSSLSSTPSLSGLLCFSQRNKINNSAESEDDIAKCPSLLTSHLSRNSRRSRKHSGSSDAAVGEPATHLRGLRRRRSGNGCSRNAGHRGHGVRAAQMDISDVSRGDRRDVRTQEFANSQNTCCCIRYKCHDSNKKTRQNTKHGEYKGHEFCITNFNCLSSHTCSNNSARNVTDTICNNNNNRNKSQCGSFLEDNESPPEIVCKNNGKDSCCLNARNGTVCLGKCPISARYAGVGNPETSPYYTVLPSLSFANNNSSHNNNNNTCSRHPWTHSLAGKMMLEAAADEAAADESGDAGNGATPLYSQRLPSAGPANTFVAYKEALSLDMSPAVCLSGVKCATRGKTACDNCRPCHNSASASLLSEPTTLPTSQPAISSTTSRPSTRSRNNTGISLNYITAAGRSEVPLDATNYVDTTPEPHVPSNTIEQPNLSTLKPYSSAKESWFFHHQQQRTQVSKSSHLSSSSSDSKDDHRGTRHSTSVPQLTSTSVPHLTSTSVPQLTSTSVPHPTSTSVPQPTSTSVPHVTSTSLPHVTSTSSNPSTVTQYHRSPLGNSPPTSPSQQTSPQPAALSFLKSDSTLSPSFSSSSVSPLANDPSSPTQSTTVQCKWADCSCELDSSDLLEHIRKHAELQVEKKTYACFWVECKVFNKPSWSCSWLERHIITHSGHRPFKCILDSCGQRFHSQAALERHVNGHFTATTSQYGVKSNRAREDLTHRMLQKRKMHLKRRFAHIVKMNDLFDERTMSVVKHELHSLMEYTRLDLVGFALHITFRGLVIGRRLTKSGNTQSLVEFKPNGVLDSKWIPEAETQQLSEVTTSLPRLPTDTVGNLHNSLYRRHRFRKHRRK